MQSFRAGRVSKAVYKMKFTPAFFVLFIISGFFFWGCKPMPNDGIPFYLKVDSVNVTAQPALGLNTHGIRDVWVEANAENLGAFERPANFPVLLEGDVRFVLSAGIEQSGQSGYRVIYPFYTSDTFTLNAERGEKYTRIPEFKYQEGCTARFVDDFNVGSIFTGFQLKLDSNSKYNQCGVLSVTSVDSNEMATSMEALDLPEGQEIWLEFDYKTDVPFYVGYYGEGSGTVIQIPVVFVNVQATWNHMYVKLSEPIAATDAPTYRIYFEALRIFGTAGGNVYVDNVRLVHPKM